MKQAQRELAEGILFTDQYQLTMAQLYYRAGLHEQRVQFDHFFRRYPDYGAHQAGYCVAAGLEYLLHWMAEAHFRPQELELLRAQRGRTGRPVFDSDFLAWLEAHASFDCLSLDAIPEGRVVHPNEPLTVVRGPLAMAQLLETALLNPLNFGTLIATKAARIRESCSGRTVLEFGLRRGHGRGANEGTRAALIGGADFSSNVGMSHALGFDPKGTHAHSMVQLFMALGESELAAFRAYADLYPDDCLLLVDTINTLESGVPNAIRVFEELRRKGHDPVGIRLDSGDLAYLAVQSARMLDEAGFREATITLSNDLDELLITQITSQIRQEAPRYGVDADSVVNRLVYGVGTRLITSWGEPALGGVYKLVAVGHEGAWRPALKVSETPAKTPNPGHKRVWRLYDRRGLATADLLALDDEDPRTREPLVLRHPTDHAQLRALAQDQIADFEPLLVPVLDEGRLVAELPPLTELRRRREADVARLDTGVRRLVNPHIYHVSLSEKLWAMKQELLGQALARSR